MLFSPQSLVGWFVGWLVCGYVCFTMFAKHCGLDQPGTRLRLTIIIIMSSVATTTDPDDPWDDSAAVAFCIRNCEGRKCVDCTKCAMKRFDPDTEVLAKLN